MTNPISCPQARRLARAALEAEHPELVDDAELVVSELVTNAALHGEPPITVRILTGPTVRVEVEDAARHLPVVMPAELDATTGRGLALVAAVGARWGVQGVPPGGKKVWAGSAPVTDTEALLDAWADDELTTPSTSVRSPPICSSRPRRASTGWCGSCRSCGRAR
jgi:hypothetical protein